MKFVARICVMALVTIAACNRGERSANNTDPGVSLVEAYVQAWNSHDSLALDTLLAPGAVHEDIAQRFRGEGSEQVTGFMRELLKLQPDFKWQLTSSFAVGPNVAAEWTWTSTYTGPGPTGPVTNMRISGRGASVAEVENGRIKRFTDYYDNASFFPPTSKDSAGK